MGKVINNTDEHRTNYSKFLSALFSSLAMILLSILCLLNNLSFDFYSAIVFIKVVLPATFCFWFLGLIIGKKLDSLNVVVEKKEQEIGKIAYEIPSMFAGPADDSGGLESNAQMEIF